MDRQSFKNIDIIKCVEDSQYKHKDKSGNYGLYFNPDHYSVRDELQKESEVNCNMTVQEQVQQKNQSKSY